MNNYHTKHQLESILQMSEGLSTIYRDYVIEMLEIMLNAQTISKESYLDSLAILSTDNLNNSTISIVCQLLNCYSTETGHQLL